MPTVYVTGHRNPDTDSIASAIAYAELKGPARPEQRLHPGAARGPDAADALGARAQRRAEPQFLSHVMLRVGDLMQTAFPSIGQDDPVREAGLAMARSNNDLVPVVDGDGALVGVVTTRALARRYIRESRDTSTLREATYVHAVADVLEGELLIGEDRPLSGRVWVHSMSIDSKSGISEGDVVVVGNRVDAQKLVLELGAALLVASGGVRADRGDPRDRPRARRRGDRLTARHLRVRPHDHARGPMSRADGA